MGNSESNTQAAHQQGMQHAHPQQPLTSTTQRVTVGNECTPIPGGEGTWSWRMVIRPEGDDIKNTFQRAVLHLHPTFPQPVLEVTPGEDGTFTSGTFTGWGTFNVGVDLIYEGGEPVHVSHMLNFSAPETFNTHEVTVSIHSESQAEGPSNNAIEALTREVVLEHLAGKQFMEPNDPCFKHGRACMAEVGEAEAPRKTWVSSSPPRDDHDAPEWLTATEFEDQEAVMDAKCAHLAQLLRLSKKTVVYSGAGISVAAGIGQAARGAADGGKSTDAEPTYTHFALGRLSKMGLLHGWVQQNHDGLPQKAGFPQENINEIHGSWYDPSNPVVLYSGTLKSEQYPWMREEAETADLVLVLGTSLGGLNADQVATKTAKRSREGKSLGAVIINLQQTEQDGKATLRMFAKTDDVFKRVLGKLGATMPWPHDRILFSREDRALVPYDNQGRRCKGGKKTWLDLSPGAKIRLTEGHNIQGAGQPDYLHIGREDLGYHAEGYVLRRVDSIQGYLLEIDGVQMLLGVWWLEASKRGGPLTLPVVNVPGILTGQ